MKEPTGAQIKVVLEWCGCRQDEIELATWVCPDGTRYTRYEGMPDTDMTFLFKYAVPKAVAFLAMQPIGCPSIIQIYRWLFERWIEELKDESDHTLALFRVLWKVKESSK